MAKDNKVSQQKELNELKEEYNKLTQDENANKTAVKALDEKIKALSEEINKSAATRLELAEKELENAQQNHAIMEKIAQLDGDREGLQDTLIAQQESIVKLKEAELIALVESVKLGEQTEDQIIKRKKELQDELKLEREKLKLKQDQAEAYDAVEGKVANTVSGLLGSVDASKTFVGQLLLAKNHSGGMSGVISNVGKGLATALKPANLMAGLFAKVAQSSMKAFVSMDNFRAELAKSGASLDQYSGLMENTTNQTAAAGVSMKDAQQSILALRSGMSSFNTMNKADQQVLTNTTAIMSKLGVDAQTSAGNLDILTKSMGMNGTEAATATKEIAATAKALSVSQEKMAADFAAAAPVLSAHGEAGVQIFRKLAAQSKATGIEMGALLGIANQFDTFEGAAEAAGKLNAVLGTQLNSVELLTATESERIKILQQSVTASGQSWESMNKFERQTVAAAAGISDVNEAGKLFGTTAQQMENAAGAAEKMALADKELAKQAASASTAGEKLALIAERFGVVMIPLIDTVHWLLDGILKLNQLLGGYFIPVMTAVIGLWWLSTAATKRAIVAKKADLEMALLQRAAKEAGIVTASGELVATETQTAATNKGILAKIKDRMATVARTIATGISTVAGWAWIAMKGVYNAITKASILLTLRETAAKIAGWVWDKIIIIWEGLKAIAKWAGFSATVASTSAEAASIPVKIASTAATTAAVGPTLAFGAAVMMVGAGVAMAALGVAELVKAFAGLDVAQILGAVAAILIFGITMLALVGILGILVYTGLLPAAAAGMMAFGFAALMMGAAVMLAAIGFALIVKSLGEFFSILAEHFMILPFVALGIVMLGAALYVLAGGMVALGLAAPAMIIAGIGLAILSSALFEIAIAMMIMASAVAIVAISMPIIVNSLERLSEIGSALTESALGLGLLTLAFGSLAVLSLFIIPIVTMVGVLTLGILALAAALSFIKTDDLRAVADMAQGLGSITLDSAVAFGKAMLETKETIVAIAREPEAAQALTAMTQAFAPAAAGGGTTTTTNNITGAADKAVPVFITGQSAEASKVAGDSGNREIVLKLNKDVFARAVINIFEKEQDLNSLG